ncbi:MAG: choice-of-anchor A family protein [Cyanobacteria bacterium J06639_16]
MRHSSSLQRTLTLTALPVAIAFGGALKAEAVSYSLGEAADYNVVVFGDYTLTNTDVQGKLAVGGDFTANTFGVGAKLQGDGHGDTLVVGGDVNLSNGKVYGDAVYGGSATVTDDVGFEFRAPDNTIIRRGEIRQDTPVDFADLEQSLKALASSIATSAMGLNYTTLVEPIGGGMATTISNATTSILYEQYDDATLATLIGTDENENVFNIEAGALDNLKKLVFDVPETAKVIINIEGDAVDLSGFGIFFGDQDCNPGTTDTVHFWCRERGRNVLFNIEEASTLNISEVGFMGSILAPNADVDFNNGHINGTLIAGKLEGTGESHLHLFKSDTPEAPKESVPEPTALLGLGLLGLGFTRLKQSA